MEAETTIKYPFGEAPKGEIWERHKRFVAQERPEDSFHYWVWAFTTGDLLTVLDALKWRSMVYIDSDDPADVERNKNPEFSPSGTLRISILAALGINEGGE